MNKKLDSQIIHFMNLVGRYMFLEYDSKYFKTWHDKDLLNNTLYDLIGSYYLGGNNVPDTARYVVDYLERFVLTNSKES